MSPTVRRATASSGRPSTATTCSPSHQTTKWSVEECRRGRGPKLIEAKTYRLSPHTSSDDDRRYRPRTELEEWIKKDPIDRFRKRLFEDGELTETRTGSGARR